MKLFSVVAAATAATTFAACAIKQGTTGCTTDDCYYKPGSPEVPAVTKEAFVCAPKPIVYSCKEGATAQTPSNDDQQKLVTKCLGGKQGKFDTAKECTDLGAECVATQTVKKADKKAKVDATCVAKTCANYAKDKDTCEKAKLDCVFKPKVDTVAATYKCASQDGNTDAKKTKCEAAKTENSGCVVADNGGPYCCKQVVDKAGKAGSLATCAAKTTTTTSNAAMAVTSAFAAAAAALLM